MLEKTTFVICLFLCINLAYCVNNLWSKGVVHYAINQKDYDLHSQDEIMSTLNEIQNEICVKFFNTPFNYSMRDNSYKILYINNPDKQKSCPPGNYSFEGNVVNMVVGYKCVSQRDIARLVVEMLRASIAQTVSPLNSYDLMMKFKSVDKDTARSGLLSPTDRNFINAHYHSECGNLDKRPPLPTGQRRSGLRPEEVSWYADKTWPLGIVMYTVEPSLRGSAEHSMLKYAMTAIELASCVVFQFIDSDNEAVILPTNILIFTKEGEDAPALGFQKGAQMLSLKAITTGAPGHTAHAINNLMRALGIPMMSNRHDRDNYVAINWKYVDAGKGHFLEKAPSDAWIQSIPYDFNSVTHAPANFMCKKCLLGQRTVEPLQVRYEQLPKDTWFNNRIISGNALCPWAIPWCCPPMIKIFYPIFIAHNAACVLVTETSEIQSVYKVVTKMGAPICTAAVKIKKIYMQKKNIVN